MLSKPVPNFNVSPSTTGESTGPLTDLWVKRRLLQTVVNKEMTLTAVGNFPNRGAELTVDENPFSEL